MFEYICKFICFAFGTCNDMCRYESFMYRSNEADYDVISKGIESRRIK